MYPLNFEKRMKSLVKAAPEPGLQYSDVNVPICGPNDILIRTKKTGCCFPSYSTDVILNIMCRLAICGTDLHIWSWDEWAQRTVPTPMTTGHEFVGTIAEIGDSVQVC